MWLLIQVAQAAGILAGLFFAYIVLRVLAGGFR